MSILLLILILLITKESYFVKDETDARTKALSKETTDGVRGLFVILVFMTHYVTYIPTGAYDTVYLDLRSHMGQAVVIPFLFYSGYGLFIQYEKNGYSYLKKLAFERIPGTVMRFAIAVCCFWIIGILQGNVYPLKKILLTFLAWDSMGNSNWYVFGIVGEYLIFLISYGIFAKEDMQDSKFSRGLSAAITIYLSVLLVMWLRHMGRPDYCYNTLMMFPFGVICANLKKKLVRLPEWTCFLVSLIIYRVAFQNRFESLVWYTIWAATFMVICIILSTKIKIDGGLIRFCSSHVFSIYILQRLPMNILDHIGWTKSSPYVCFFICMVVTGMIAVIFDLACNWITTQGIYMLKHKY